MWLTKLETTNFRLLEEFVLEFAPDVTVLVGANNVGKSNVVDALLLPKQAQERGNYWDALEDRRGLAHVVSRHQIDATVELRFAFAQGELAGEYLVALGPHNTLSERLALPGALPFETSIGANNRPQLARDDWLPLGGFFRSIVHIDPFRQVAFQTAIPVSG